MKTVFEATILNPYRSKIPRGFYNPIKGHTGVDLNYVNEELPSPIIGTVVGLLKQAEMGNVMYVEDIWKNIHVFAHLKEFKKNIHDKCQRKEIITITGNTGLKTTNPHLHYEVITTIPIKPWPDRIMVRRLYSFKGYNTDPINYLKKLYSAFNVPIS